MPIGTGADGQEAGERSAKSNAVVTSIAIGRQFGEDVLRQGVVTVRGLTEDETERLRMMMLLGGSGPDPLTIAVRWALEGRTTKPEWTRDIHRYGVSLRIAPGWVRIHESHADPEPARRLADDLVAAGIPRSVVSVSEWWEPAETAKVYESAKPPEASSLEAVQKELSELRGKVRSLELRIKGAVNELTG